MKSRALWAEFVGTFALIFVGMMAMATNVMEGAEIGRVGIALAHGFAIAALASATMAISGGHLNPAVSFGAFLAGRITGGRMIGYWIVQAAGAISAAYCVQAMVPADLYTNSGYGMTLVNEAMMMSDFTTAPWLMAALVEAVITFLLVYVVLGTGADWRAHKVGGLAIGLAVTMGILAAGPLTGAAMNPARWLGPAFVQNDYSLALVYILGPMFGAALATVLYGRIPEEQRLAA